MNVSTKQGYCVLIIQQLGEFCLYWNVNIDNLYLSDNGSLSNHNFTCHKLISEVVKKNDEMIFLAI